MIDPTNPDFINTPVSPQRPYFNYAPTDLSAPRYVTIVTPFFNTGPIFHDTARSVLHQSFQQWEWLIINDGSTDPEALVILDDYRHKDPRIRIIDHPENRGLSAARASYVVQLDSDDLLEPTAVEKWCWFLESYPEFSFVKGYTVGFGTQGYLWSKGFHNDNKFLEANLVTPISMVKRTGHESVGGYDEADRGGLMDWDFWLRCADHVYWGATVPEYLEWYRRRPRHNDRWPDFDEGERQRTYRARLREKYPRLWKGEFPKITLREHMPYETVLDELPCENRLHKDKRRLLLLV